MSYQAELGAHRAGTLTLEPLNRLEWYLQEHFDGKPVHTVETGCGASTIVFAQYAEQHLAYCYDDREFEASSVSYARQFPGFREEPVNWIFGPTQQTVFSHPLEQPVDVILLDGPHGYPFPELEYFAFYKSLRPGGILIVDDVHIPTINNLYRFLLEDDAFVCLELASTTAYFQRTDSPDFDMEGDGWWLQRYNAQRFPAVPGTRSEQGLRLPIRLDFDGVRVERSAFLSRGFSYQDGQPVTDGVSSVVELRLAHAVPPRIRIGLDIEPICPSERQGGLAVLVNAREAGSWTFDSPARRTIEVQSTAAGSSLRLEFRHTGLKPANDLEGWPHLNYDARLPNFYLHSLSVGDASTDGMPNTLRRADGTLVNFEYEAQPFTFFLDQPDDPVQQCHAVGQFSDLEALEALRTGVRRGASILDIGAGGGNHSVYFDRVMQAKRVVAIEADPRAQNLLRTNCLLNGLAAMDLSHLDEAPAGLAGERFDVVRIDARGIEIDVLEGLSDTLQRCRPLLLVEVQQQNWERLLLLLKRWGLDVNWQSEWSEGRTKMLVAPGTGSAHSSKALVGPPQTSQATQSSKPSVFVPDLVVRAARRMVPETVRKAISARVMIHPS
jgi:precorrin-6B methylase 2